MKSIFTFIAALLFLPAIMFAQANPLDGLLEQYSGEKGFYYLDLNTNMFLGSSEDESKEYYQKVNIKMLSYEEGQGNTKEIASLHELFFNQFDNADYIGLVDVKTSEEKVEVLIKKKDKVVTEFIFLIQEKKSITLMAAAGNFDLKDLAKLKSLQNCRGFQIMQQMCDE